MNRWERWTFGLLTLGVLLSGGAYFWMKYLLVNDDPFSVVNHPWQSAMLAAHVLAAPGLLLMFGILVDGHVRRKVGASRITNRRSGFVSFGSFFVMAASGYLLQVLTSDAVLGVTSVVHVVSGVLFGVSYLAHLVISVRLTRSSPVGIQEEVA